MIENNLQPEPNHQIKVYVDIEKLLANPEFRAHQTQMQTRMRELKSKPADTLNKMVEKWMQETDPQEISETYDFLMKALAENDF